MYGTSYVEPRLGCPDSDGDGVSDAIDSCPYDDSINLGAKGQVDCAKFDDHDNDGIPNEFDSDFVAGSDDGAWNLDLDSEILVLLGLVIFLLAVISVALVAKQAGKRKSANRRAEDMKVSAMFQEEEERKRKEKK